MTRQMTRIAINGFGRIGRMAFRAALARPDVEVVAVNDLLELPHLAYLLAHDSVRGRLGTSVSVDSSSRGALVVGGRRVRATAVKDPSASAWGEVGAAQLARHRDRSALDRGRGSGHVAGAQQHR